MKKNSTYQQVLEHPGIRTATARQSFEWFFGIYLNEFMTYKTAPFQKKMFEIAENEKELLSVIISFRGSAKTTIMALAYPIWAVLGKQNRKFVLIISDTQDLARQRLANIRKQLEANKLLRAELGPFKEDPPGEWSVGSIVIQKYDARIMVVSREQSIRGVIHNQYRPDLIILDDVENLDSVRTKESRDKTYRWFTEEIKNLGDKGTKIVLIGNKLHENSLYMRLEDKIKRDAQDGKYYEFPIQINGHILWPGKYPDQQALETEKRRIGDEKAWAREYELKIVPEDNQIVYPEWIHRYNQIPLAPLHSNIFLATGIDLASSDSETAHFTAMITARVVIDKKGHVTFYILPHPTNKRLLFPEQVDAIKQLDASFRTDGLKHYLFIEQVGYQRALVDELKKQAYTVEGVVPHGSKRERLTYISRFLRDKVVLFPDHGAEELITQLVHFGVERHDDLADALSLLISKVLENIKDLEVFSRIHISTDAFYNTRQSTATDWAQKEDEELFASLKKGRLQRQLQRQRERLKR